VADRIQLSRKRGWRMPEGAVKVDRSTRWGNIFWPGQRVISPGAYGSDASPYHGCRPVGEYGTGPRGYAIREVRGRADAVALFAGYVRRSPGDWPRDDIWYSLGGRSLACWCSLPDEPGEPDICHAAWLVGFAATLAPP
jgi:hypothetical protein